MTSRRVTPVLIGLLAPLLAAAQAAPNDPYFAHQWGLQRVGAPQAWQVSRGEGVVVAVIDSGVDLAHPDLAGAFVRGRDGRVVGHDFVDDDADPTDEHGHGTMVAGLVSARTANGRDVASAAPLAAILPVRVLDGEAAGTSAEVDAGIRWAVEHGADVINLSLEVAQEAAGSRGLPALMPRASDSAIRYAWERGVAVVAAAGNDSDQLTDYPPDAPILLVGATDRQDRRAAFSDSGRDDVVMAPGVEIISTWCSPCGRPATHTVGQSDGTSYAAPLVSGLVALLRARGLTSMEAVRRIRATAVDLGPPGRDDETGYGRINAAAAVGYRPPPPRPRAASTKAAPPQRVAGSRRPPRPVSKPAAVRSTQPPPLPRTPARAPTTPRPQEPRRAVPPLPVAAPTEPTHPASPLAARDGNGAPNRGWQALAGVLVGINLAGLAWTARRGRGGP